MRLTLVALNASYPHTNLALRLIRRQVPPEWECRLLERHINLPRYEVLRDILRTEPDCVGFSCYLWNRDLCLHLGAAIKRALPHVFVYFGGPEAENDPAPFLESGDAVSRGEGESTVAPLLRGVAAGDVSTVPGLVTKAGENPIPAPMSPENWPDAYAAVFPPANGSPKNARQTDADAAAFSPAGVCPPNAGTSSISPSAADRCSPDAESLAGRIVYVETSRGCPYRCGYCLSAGDRIRALDVEESVRRLTTLADGGVSLIKLVDRTFNFDRDRANRIWAALIQHHTVSFVTSPRREAAEGSQEGSVPLAQEVWRAGQALQRLPRYHFEIAANLLNEDSFRILAKAPAGLFQFEAGIQSTNEKTLDAVGRTAPTQEILSNLRRVIALKTIPVHVDLIAGLPEEDLSSFGRSYDETYALGADMLQLGFLKLLPGSRLQREAERYGLMYDPAPPYEVLRTPWLTSEELCLLHDVEKTADWYDGASPSAMRALSQSMGPFAARLRLARELRAAGSFDRDMTEKNRMAALYRIFPAVGSLIAHDLLLRGRPLPESLEETESEPLRALLRARFHPVRGQRARAYAADPRIPPEETVPARPVILIYDHGNCTEA